MTGKRHGFHATWRAGFDDDGRLLALEGTLTSDGGWSLDLSEPVLARALCHVDNAYWIPHVRVHGRIAKTHKTSQTAFRGFGGPQGMLVIEDVLGSLRAPARARPGRAAAAQLLRRGPGHAVRPAGAARRPAGRRVGPGRRDRRPRGRRAEIAAFNDAHPHTKRALAVTPVKFGISFNFTALQPGRRPRARLQGRLGAGQPRRHRDGPGPAHQDAPGRGDRARACRWTGSGSAPTRTDKVPNTSATAASAGADLNGGAVKDACEQILRRLDTFRAGREVGVGRPGARGLLRPGAAVGGRLLPHRGAALGRVGDAGLAVQVLRLRRVRGRDRGRRLHRRLPHPPGRHRPRRRRLALAAGRPRSGRGRLRPGRRLADPGGPALGRLRRGVARSAVDPVRQHLQAAQPLRDARGLPGRLPRPRPRGRCGLRLQGGGRAAADAGPRGPGGVAPGRGGLRAPGVSVELAVAGHAGGGLVGARAGPREQPRERRRA